MKRSRPSAPDAADVLGPNVQFEVRLPHTEEKPAAAAT